MDKKFQYYQENRDEYYELKQTLMRMVLETSVKSLYDELNSIEEYMEIIEHAEDKELGKYQKYCLTFNSLVMKYHKCSPEIGVIHYGLVLRMFKI